MFFRQMIIFAVLMIGVANSQSWKIYTIDNNTIKLDNLSIVQNDTLVGIKSGDVIEVPVQKILNVRYKNPNVGKGIKGGCFGFIIAAPLGAMLFGNTGANYETGGTIGIIFGVSAGYLIFSKSFGTQYNLYNNLTLEQKVDKINSLIEKYKK